MRSFVLSFSLLLGCSGVSLNDAGPESDPAARALLARDVGVLVTQSSASLDSAAIEAIVPGTHRRVLTTGFALDVDMQLRRLVDARGRERLFTLQATQGAVVERDRDGRELRRYDVYDGVPARANPLDLAFDADDNLWITRHGERSLWIAKTDGSSERVDLSAFADDDGVPDMSAITIVDRTAYVALRRMEKGFGTTKNTSTVVAIDTASRAVRPFVELPAKDPGPRFQLVDGALWISCIGGPLMKPEPDRSAALVRIDLQTGATRTLLDAERTGGFVTAFVIEGDRGYAVIADFARDNPTRVVRFDARDGASSSAWLATSGYQLWSLAIAPGASGERTLLVGDRTESAPGLRVLSLEDGASLGKIPTRLLPIDLLVLRSPDD